MKQGAAKQAVQAHWAECEALQGIRRWRDAEVLLAQYVEILLQGSKRRGLLAESQRNEESSWGHILDSLQPMQLVAESGEGSVLDAGSGAGLPGVPLAIAFPERRFVLVERAQPKADFLQLVAAKCGLQNVAIEPHDLSPESVHALDPGLVIMRAVVNAESEALPGWLRAVRSAWIVFATDRNRDDWVRLAEGAGFQLRNDVIYTIVSAERSRHLLKFVAS